MASRKEIRDQIHGMFFAKLSQEEIVNDVADWIYKRQRANLAASVEEMNIRLLGSVSREQRDEFSDAAISALMGAGITEPTDEAVLVQSILEVGMVLENRRLVREIKSL